MTKPVHFNILARDSQSPARLGQLDLPHGSVQTPIFMPVGTYGTVKAITPRDLHEAKAKIILGWEPKVERAEGLQKTYDYFKALPPSEWTKLPRQFINILTV